jgi:sugar phosphate isomerase/epimerase
MRIGVSNLLWTPDLDADAARLLNQRGIDAIDIAPTRYFDDIAAATPAEFQAVRRFWQQQGIEITGMQALLHGTGGLSIFGSESTRRRTRRHLSTILEIGGQLGARQLVFGSWRNRDRGSLGFDAAIERAAEFFGELAVQAERLGVCLSIEPISERYGNNFLVDHDEAARLVARIGSPGFGLTLDIGCVALAGEDVDAIVREHGPLIGHVQLAEYQLAPLSAANPAHARAGPIVSAGLPGRVACIEALKPPDLSSLDAIAQSLDVAQAHYV